jgi:hypothetical protein
MDPTQAPGADNNAAGGTHLHNDYSSVTTRCHNAATNTGRAHKGWLLLAASDELQALTALTRTTAHQSPHAAAMLPGATWWLARLYCKMSASHAHNDCPAA